MLDISKLWLLFDVLAALLIVLNIFLMVRKKNKFTAHIAFFSITFECLALLAELQQVLNKVVINDVSFILDVIPSLGNIRTPIVFVLLFVNITILVFDSLINFTNKITKHQFIVSFPV